MTTDNRTNEQLAERLRQFAESQAMDFDSPHVAMTLNEIADRLSGTVTEAQVEAAAKAMHERDLAKSEELYPNRPSMWAKLRPAYYEHARAALVAAQGAAADPGRILLRKPDGTPKTNAEIRAEARAVHATLAIAEQARVANIISLSVKQGLSHGVEAWVSSWDEELNAEGELTKIELRPDIAAALGLTAGQEGEAQ